MLIELFVISLYKSEDYKKAKIPMLPLTNGIESTKLNIFIWSQKKLRFNGGVSQFQSRASLLQHLLEV